MATRIVIIGGGPAGYEAALVAALAAGRRRGHRHRLRRHRRRLRAVGLRAVQDVHRLDRRAHRTAPRAAASGSTSRSRTPRSRCRRSTTGSRRWPPRSRPTSADQLLQRGRQRRRTAAASWSTTRPAWPHHRVKVTTADGTVGVLKADVVLIATGASPRVLPDARARRRAHPELAPALRPRRSCPSTWSSSAPASPAPSSSTPTPSSA